MKIGYDFRLGGRLHAGIGRYSKSLLESLVISEPENEYVIFYRESAIHPEDLTWLKSQKQISLVKANFRHYSLAEQILFPRLIKRAGVNLMHFPNFNVPIFCPVPFVVTVHDMVHHSLRGHKLSSALWFQGYKFVMTQALQKSRLVITPSQHSKEEILSYYPHLPKDKVVVIYEGATVTTVTAEQIQKTKEDFLITKPYFLFVGTLERKRDLPTLAKGFDIFVQSSGLDMDLVVAGKVDAHYPMERVAFLQIRNANRVILTGQVTENELSALYQGSFAYVQPSPNEGFGLPGVEAMQFNLPLLVANTPVFNELYDRGALYFKPGDFKELAEQMTLLARDRKFYEQMRERSHEQGQKFSWLEAAEETIRTYNKALGTHDAK